MYASGTELGYCCLSWATAACPERKQESIPIVLEHSISFNTVHAVCACAGANKRFKQLLLQQTGAWDEESAELLVNFKGE
jgi:hypothetical protein